MNTESFLASLAVHSSSRETMRAYRQALTRFESFLRERNLRVTQVKRSTIAEFVEHLAENKGRTRGEALAPATIGRQLSILSSFFNYLGENSDGRIRNPIEHMKRPKISNNLPRAVDELTLTTLMEGISNARDKAIILLFVYSGLRLSELAQLDKASIRMRRRVNPDGAVLYFGYGEVVGKGNKTRDFRVAPRAIGAVVEYLRKRGEDENPALFLSSHRKRISTRAIQSILDTWCRRLNVAHVHIHQLRHSFATRNVNAGMSLSVLQSLLGHAHPDTTGRYFRIQSDRKTREYFSVMEYLGETAAL